MKIKTLLVLISCLVFINNSIYSMGNPNERLLDGAKNNNIDLVQSAIKEGADIDFKSPTGITALMFAAYNEDENIMELLLKSGANPNIQDLEYGNTALLYAIKQTNKDIVELLLKYKANPDIPNKKGATPLLAAAQHGNYEILKLLLDHNANPNVKTKDNKTIFSFIFDINAQTNYNQRIKIIKLLLNKNIVLSSEALIGAINKVDTEIVRLLLEAGVPIEGASKAIEGSKKNPQINLLLPDQIKEIEELVENEKKKREAISQELNKYLIGDVTGTVDEYLYYK